MTILNKLLLRINGPLGFRFILQPIAAIMLGIRDGKIDAASNEKPYIFDLCVNPKNRKRQIDKAIKTLLKPIIISIIMDIAAQFLLFKTVNLWGAVIIGTFIMGIPYSLARGISNRILSSSLKDKNSNEGHVHDSNK